MDEMAASLNSLESIVMASDRENEDTVITSVPQL